MKDHKTQYEINLTEWKNPDNWSTIYFSKKDSRACVPKKNPKHGWTINFGNPSGALWIYYLFVIFMLLGCFTGFMIAAGMN